MTPRPPPPLRVLTQVEYHVLGYFISIFHSHRDPFPVDVRVVRVLSSHTCSLFASLGDEDGRSLREAGITQTTPRRVTSLVTEELGVLLGAPGVGVSVRTEVVEFVDTQRDGALSQGAVDIRAPRVITCPSGIFTDQASQRHAVCCPNGDGFLDARRPGRQAVSSHREFYPGVHDCRGVSRRSWHTCPTSWPTEHRAHTIKLLEACGPV